MSEGNRLIFIEGMIDAGDEGGGSLIPAEGALNTDAGPAMDKWISAHSDGAYPTYREWVESYAAACTAQTHDGSSKPKEESSPLHPILYKMHNDYKNTITFRPKSGTTIIGLGGRSGIRGGSIVLGDSKAAVSNVVIRNLVIEDAVDMFPKHETDDGYNSSYDGITIQFDCENIWIDHCTFIDTLEMAHVMTGGELEEKWQTYDGDCDIKGTGKGITVSNCHFYRHDKTMLIGSGDKEDNNQVRKVSILGNWFDTCSQRLPMVRNSRIHVAGNYYSFDTEKEIDGRRSTFYAIGARRGSLIFSEGNFFDTGVEFSYSGSQSTAETALVCESGCIDNSSKKGNAGTYTPAGSSAELGWKPSDYYEYKAIPAEKVPASVMANAGAGKLEVRR